METQARALTSRILVPLDGSEQAEQALAYALALGGRETEVILLAVVPRASNVRNVFGKVIGSSERVQEGYREVSRQSLERAASRLSGQRTVHQEVATGDAAEQILRVAAERGVGMIVMTALGRGTFAGWALGSTADRVTRAARQPVMIVHRRGATEQPGTAVRISGLVLPVDGSEHAAGALPVVAALAGALDVPVRVLQVVADGDASPPASADEPAHDASIEEVRAGRRADAERAVEDAVMRMQDAGTSAAGEVRDGEPASTVIATAGADEVVVLTSHGAAGAGRWGLGGVADKVLRDGSVSVVLVPSAVRGDGGAS